MAFQFDFESIGKVVDAVRGAGGEVPASFYPDASSGLRDPFAKARECRSMLGHSIASAFTWRDGFHELWTSKTAERNYQDLETMAKLADKLAALLDKNDGELVRLLADRFPDPQTGRSLPQGASVLRSLASAAMDKRETIEAAGLLNTPIMDLLPRSQNAPGGWDNVKTPADAFTLGLQDAFREFFGEPAIHQDEEGEPYGPFVAFVQAVRRADGEPVTAGAVKKAVDRANGRGRDRGGEI